MQWIKYKYMVYNLIKYKYAIFVFVFANTNTYWGGGGGGGGGGGCLSIGFLIGMLSAPRWLEMLQKWG